MSPLLPGLHDIESSTIAPPDTWLLDTVALSDNPPPKTYPPSLHVIARLNWGYGSAGTLPLPSVYEAFAQMVAVHVNGTRNCKRWIIGNEPNLSREWPDNTPIYPWHYAACYKLCREAIHALPGHGQDEVLIAASGPWNAELKYDGNPDGDWITYFSDVIDLIGDACDGYSIHAYTHGYDVSLVTSSARMDHPFQNHYYEFYTYRDYCEAIPPELRYLPVYLTEANGNGPWQAVGLMPAMLQEIDSWNHTKLPKIHSVIFYRYSTADEDARFAMSTKRDVMAEYQRAVALGYQSPLTPRPPTPTPEPPDPPRPTPEPIDWDKRLTARGCTLQPALFVGDDQVYERVNIGRWFDRDEAQGRVSVYVRLLDERGQLAIGVPVTWFWSSGSETKLTERKSDPWLESMGLGREYSCDFAMYAVAPSYGVRIDSGNFGNIIDGCGLGSIEQPDYKIHTAYFFEWQLSSEGITEPILPPIPPVVPLTGHLIWPVSGPITQYFGRHEIEYPGSPGHDGIDFGIPIGTEVVAVADGIVKWVDNDPSGFGLYIRIFLPAHGFHGVMAHLSRQLVTAGQRVTQGETIGLSGNSGNSTGPHLHYSTRIGEEDVYFELHDGYDNGCANPLVVHGLINKSDPNMREEA
jgi:hypothetical protein